MNDRQRTALLVTLAVAALTVLFPRFQYDYGRSGHAVMDEHVARAFHRLSPPKYAFLFGERLHPFSFEAAGMTLDRSYYGEPDWAATLPVTLLVLLAGAGAYVVLGRRRDATDDALTK